MSFVAMPKLAELLGDPSKVSLVPSEAIPAMLGELERLKATLWARLTLPQNGQGQAQGNGGRLLSAKEVAGRMGMSLDYVYKNASEFPFAVKEGRRVLFSESGMEQYLQEKMKKKGLDV